MASTIETKPFKHEALPNASTYIRLLKVTSVDLSRDIPIHCELTTWLKASAPAYTAISYTWGDSDSVATILVNGEEMKVGRNCEDVLKQQCWAGGGHFWIDAICINQADNHEKSFQVAKMGEVYKDACQTLACVGNHADDSEFLFETLHLYHREYVHVGLSDHSSVFLERLKVAGSEKLEFMLYLKENLNDENTLLRLDKALIAFLTRCYFQRVWIYQELFFGNDLHFCCANETLRSLLLGTLYATLDWLMRWPFDGVAQNSELLAYAQSRYFAGDPGFLINNVVKGEKPIAFSKMISVAQGLQCKDPRDRVFGMLAMIDWEGETPILPDYDKDTYDLAVEVLRRQKRTFGDYLPSLLLNTIGIAGLVELPNTPSKRLDDEMRARRSRERVTVGAGSMSQPSDSQLTLFWAHRIFNQDARWSIEWFPAKPPLDGPELGAESPANELDVSLSETVAKWSEGTLWDVQGTQILLPEETKSEDWLLTADKQNEHPYSNQPTHPVALIARGSCRGQLQLVGKALLDTCQIPNAPPPWEKMDHHYCGVYLDYKDLIVLARSCNWRNDMDSFLSDEKEPHLLQVDEYFQTKLCGDRSETYAKWIKAETEIPNRPLYGGMLPGIFESRPEPPIPNVPFSSRYTDPSIASLPPRHSYL